MIRLAKTDTDTRVMISTLDLISNINVMIQANGGHDGSGRIYITPNGIYTYQPRDGGYAAILDLGSLAGDWPISALRGQAADIAADWLTDHCDLTDGDIWALRDPQFFKNFEKMY